MEIYAVWRFQLCVPVRSLRNTRSPQGLVQPAHSAAGIEPAFLTSGLDCPGLTLGISPIHRHAEHDPDGSKADHDREELPT